MIEPDAIYLDPDGLHYIAQFPDEDGYDVVTWLRWPAIENGWASRRACSETLADDCDELPAELARFALLASGVGDD